MSGFRAYAEFRVLAARGGPLDPTSLSRAPCPLNTQGLAFRISGLGFRDVQATP